MSANSDRELSVMTITVAPWAAAFCANDTVTEWARLKADGKEDVTRPQTHEAGHVGLAAFGRGCTGHAQELEDIGAVLRDHSRLVQPHSQHPSRSCESGHRFVEARQVVLGDGLFETEGIRLEGTSKDVLLDGETKLVLVDNRAGCGAQAIFVTGRLLEFRVPGKAEGLGETHHRGRGGVALLPQFLRAQVTDLFQVVDYVAGDGLL